jgi:hypothetical protein
MKRAPRIPGCREDLPRVSMSPDAHYARTRFWHRPIAGSLLTDQRIAFYLRHGHYQQRRLKQVGRNRLVYSC